MPKPSSNSNTIVIPINNQNIGTEYVLKWYDSETGLEYNSGGNQHTPVQHGIATVQLHNDGLKYLSIEFPSWVRDLQTQTIHNTFGDAVFSLNKRENSKKTNNEE